MDYDGLISRWNGRQVTAYGGECVALAAQYCVENGKPIAYANAKDWWGHGALIGAFNFIANNPNDLKQVPARGDIIIWNGGLAGSGGYGHIAIFDRVTGPGAFVSFDQNWGGRQAHFVTHNWNNIIGWMKVKQAAPAPAPSTGGIVLDRGQVNRLYQLILHREGDPGGLNNYTGKSLNETLEDISKSQEWLTQNHQILVSLPDAQKQINSLTNTINSLNQQVTDINNQNNSTRAEKDAALAQIAKLTADLSTAIDKLKEAQNQPQIPPQPTGYTDSDRQRDAATNSMLTSVFNYFSGQFKTFQKYIRRDK